MIFGSLPTLDRRLLNQLPRIGGSVNSGGGIVPVTMFSDDFNRADGGLGDNWDVLAGSFAIASNNAVGATAGFAKNLAIWKTPLTGSNQWARLNYEDNDDLGGFVGPCFRFTDASSPHYLNDYNFTQDFFTYYESVGYTAVVGDNYVNGSTTPAWPGINFSETIVGTTLEGTNDATTLRYWFWAAASPPGQLVPTSPSVWNSIAPTIEIVLSGKPRYVNTGVKVGICAFFGDPGESAKINSFAAGAF